MAKATIRRIVDLVVQAQQLAKSIGIDNLLQPGLVKELIIADVLNHKVIISKHDADACDPDDASVKYEYLSCKEEGTGQLDRMYSKPPLRRAKSLARISRNSKVYFAVFFRDNQIKLKAIYELEPDVVLAEAKRKLDRSRSSHIGFGIRWAKQNGKLVYEDPTGN